MQITELASSFCFSGEVKKFSHYSEKLKCDMKFSIFLPSEYIKNKLNNNIKYPVLYWLSGLTCNEDNFMQKSGIQQIASRLGVIIVAPDTSPRGDNIPDDPDKNYDFGLGAGFYINATQSPWSENYHMYSYIVEELPEIINNNFNVSDTNFISGHSMGGHGALVIGLNNPDKYKSISVFSPICNPINCPWGIKAFSNYLGDNKATWEKYDTIKLLETKYKNKSDLKIPILIDQGESDEFLEPQLKTDALINLNYPNINIRKHKNYDHSYYFIASFIKSHLEFHFSNIASIS